MAPALFSYCSNSVSTKHSADCSRHFHLKDYILHEFWKLPVDLRSYVFTWMSKQHKYSSLSKIKILKDVFFKSSNHPDNHSVDYVDLRFLISFPAVWNHCTSLACKPELVQVLTLKTSEYVKQSMQLMECSVQVHFQIYKRQVSHLCHCFTEALENHTLLS